MGTMHVGKLVLALGAIAWLQVGSWGPVGLPGTGAVAMAAESISVDGLPKEPKAFRNQVDQILKKVDGLIAKLKGKAEAKAIVLDLIQTRDNVLREIPKVESTPDGSKWSQEEGRASVEAMLKLLKDQYEKGTDLDG